MERQRNSSGTSSQDLIRCSSATKSKVYCADWEKHQKILPGRILFMSMFNDISCGTKDNEKECLAHTLKPRIFVCKKIWKRAMVILLVLVLKSKWYSFKEDSPQGIWDKIAERMLLEFAESGCPIFCDTTPLSRGQLKSKGHGKLSIRLCSQPDQETIETIFRIIVSANQLSLYGAVAEMCEEYESLHERSGATWCGDWTISCAQLRSRQKFLWIVIDPTNKELLVEQYGRTNWKIVTNKINWVNFVWMQDFWMLLKLDSISWLKTLESWHNFMQWPVVNTLFQEKNQHHNRKRWIQGNTKNGPVLESYD